MALKNKSNRNLKKFNRLNKAIRNILTALFIMLLIIILYAIIKYGGIVIEYQKEAKQIVSACSTEDFKAEQTSLIYDSNGTLITTMKSEKDVYYLSSNEIPYLVKMALVTVEDRKFYEHSGVDYKAILRASLELIKNKGKITQGGSTITQQLSRNVFLTHDVTAKRKVKEILIAIELEKKFNKDEILEFYINNIYFANGYYGIEAAAKGYFNKSVSQLTLSEIAFLCVIPNNPSEYDPYLYFDNTMERRDRILKQMMDQGAIDEDMYKEAISETITLNTSKNLKNNFAETYIRYCATIELIKASGFEIKTTFSSDAEKEEYLESYQELYNLYSMKLYTGGYRIYTSIDLNKQKELQDVLNSKLSDNSQVNEDGIYEFQGAATCIDNNTGYVTAIIGGREQEYKGYTLNRAYQSFRQPGSSIKPILTYTPLFERGYTPDSMVEDEAISDGPLNSPNIYEGDISIRYAVIKSKNTVAWKLFEELTPVTAIGYLKEMNFSKIDPCDYVPAMSIGGMTYGVSTLEMASAYSTLENDGVFRTPTCIINITDSSGQLIVNNTIQEKQVYQQNAARMMTDILKDVLTEGTGRKYQIDNAICAGKTGTTNQNKDSWFVGYSTYYTTAVWVGYDMPKEINDTYSVSCAGLIWNDFMTSLHKDKEKQEFSPYTK